MPPFNFFIKEARYLVDRVAVLPLALVFTQVTALEFRFTGGAQASNWLFDKPPNGLNPPATDSVRSSGSRELPLPLSKASPNPINPLAKANASEALPSVVCPSSPSHSLRMYSTDCLYSSVVRSLPIAIVRSIDS
ncbi:hypothetical protein BX661DRAFT_76936 [Kickxella alabastrina]|uniref:uncharacterized protein n=1 Tax=Kickxella alabastrina TaxID=61397 RepID=UPI00221ED09F|nr:uncharacterized protein BX661DRAFT_76936 [Kickxella alabastrina]KAI7833542.1 hypothetical protein BX661DRAFT_76936 [Kickxella alabastrina]